MEKKKTTDVKGYSNEGIGDALQNALSQIGFRMPYKVVETRGIQSEVDESQYEVTLAALED